MKSKLGSWAFLLGVLIALVLGALNMVTGTVAVILIILGLIVGLLNVTEEETTPFLMAAVSLVIVSALGKDVLTTVEIVGQMLSGILLMFVPATVVVAIKHVFSLARF
ncbi:hypothetical protein HYT58_03095 [Candidatus Woesearchaeota archaeon]|nr:hypothetical protein [Candidatus Woesearchaeota archaeon]